MRMIKLDVEDWMVVVAIILIVLCHGITSFVMTYRTSFYQEEQTIKTAVEVFEANPITTWILQFDKIHFIFANLIIPAFIGGTYYYFRKKAAQLKGWIASFMLLAAVLNITNDLAVLIGILARSA